MFINAELIDAWRHAKNHPDLWKCASLPQLKLLRKDDSVLLAVTWETPERIGWERFWVDLLDTSLPLSGIVRKEQNIVRADQHGVRVGDTIFFHPCNVLAIAKRKLDKS